MSNRKKTPAERAASQARQCRWCRSKAEMTKGRTVCCASCGKPKRRI